MFVTSGTNTTIHNQAELGSNLDPETDEIARNKENKPPPPLQATPVKVQTATETRTYNPLRYSA
jgi:hypothetical protein